MTEAQSYSALKTHLDAEFELKKIDAPWGGGARQSFHQPQNFIERCHISGQSYCTMIGPTLATVSIQPSTLISAFQPHQNE